MTVLDLTEYMQAAAPLGPLCWPLLAVAVFGIIMGAGALFIIFSDGSRRTFGFLFEGLIVAFLIILAGAVYLLLNPAPSFAAYVNDAYGLKSSNLPYNMPSDGSMCIVWEKDGEIHSGTLNLLDGKLSIKEANGDYLEVTD